MLTHKPDATAGPSLEFTRVGRRKASTFTGLCARHDNQLFRPIDDAHELDLDDPEHLFLVAYRSVLRELATQARGAKLIQSTYAKLVELGKVNPDVDKEPGRLAALSMAEAWGFFRFACRFGDAFLAKEWSAVDHLVLRMDEGGCGLACSGVYDELGSMRTGDQIRDPACAALNVFPHSGEPVTVFSYLAEHGATWRRALLLYKEATGYYRRYLVSKLVLRHCENFVLQPSIFESWSERKRTLVLQYYKQNISADKVDRDDPQLLLF